MRLKHHRQIVDMLYAEWDLGKTKSGARGKTCAWIYWFEILSEAEQIITERQGGNIIGVGGYSKWGSKKHLIRKHFYRALTKLLMRSPLIKNRQAMEAYLQNYNYTPPELVGHFDGEVTLIIVAKERRGQKIGERLLSQIFHLAQRDGLSRLQILTDESCNFAFYEQMGCKKVYEKTISNGEPGKCGTGATEKGFIYEKLLPL